MRNLTLSIEDGVIRKVRKVAAQRDTTLTEIVRQYLQSVATQADAR